MDIGQVRYTTMCNANGGIVDDLTVYRRGKEHYMIVTSSGPRKRVAAWLAEHASAMRVYVTDISAAVALPVVQGPRSRELLTSIAKECDLSTLRFFRFVPARIGETDVLISRSGYTGELGYEVYTPAEEAAVVWNALLESGKDFGLMPYGVLAMQTLRLEKALPLYGVDITDELTPYHVGLDRWIRFDGRDFIGRDALLRVRDNGPDRRWVGVTLEGDVAAAVRDEVVDEAGKPIGYVTYSNRGHTVNRLLALAYVSSDRATPGTPVSVRSKGGLVRGQVAKTPFFDPESARLRA
jgi:aminomethyltransferase